MDRYRVRRLLRQDLRDAVLFFGGLGGVAHQEFSAGEPRRDLLILYAWMMGLPVFLRADESRKRRRDNNRD